MLLAQDPKLLLVDEPVAGMTDSETATTAELLCEIAKDHAVVVVEHDMTFVRDLGVKVTVLHEGAVLAEGALGPGQCRPARGGGLSRAVRAVPHRNGEGGAQRRVGVGSSRQGSTPSDSACGRATFPVSGKDQMARSRVG